MSRSRSRGLLAVALLALVVLAGCSAGLESGSGGGGGDAAAEADVEGGATAAAAAEAGGDGGGGGEDGSGTTARAAGRALIRTGEVRLRVDDYDRARDRLVSIAESRGGFVADSSERTHTEGNRTWTEGQLVLRVPSDSFPSAFRAIKDVGTVRSANSATKDVTDRLVDLEARLKNLKARRDRLRTLYDEANDTEDVLAVGRELSEVQGKIERLEAERRALKNRVAMATITVRFGEPEPAEPTPTPEPAYHETGLAAAFLASVDGVLVTIRAAAVTFAYLAPYLLAFGLPVGAIAVGLYAGRNRLRE